jgi:hypothetical protein
MSVGRVLLRGSCSSEVDERRVCRKDDRSSSRVPVALVICCVPATIARQEAQPEIPMSDAQKMT